MLSKLKTFLPKILLLVTVVTILVVGVSAALPTTAQASPANGYPQCDNYTNGKWLYEGEMLSLVRTGPTGGTDHHSTITFHFVSYESYYHPTFRQWYQMFHFTTLSDRMLNQDWNSGLWTGKHLLASGICTNPIWDFKLNKPVLAISWHQAWTIDPVSQPIIGHSGTYYPR